MYPIDVLKGKSCLKKSRLTGTQFVIKLEGSFEVYVHNKSNNNIFKISFKKDNRSENKYIINSDKFGKGKFITNGELQMILFDPIVLAKIGTGSKSKENIYFVVDDNIDIYC